MRSRTAPTRPSSTSPLRRGAAIAVLAGAVLAGCGSSDAGGDEAATDPEVFCDAVDRYAEASAIGDRTAMADALASSLDDLSPEAERDVSAYVDALRQAPANEELDGDGVEAPSTEESFRTLVADTCTDAELPPEGTVPTTTEAPIVQGGGTTDDTGVDGSGTGTGSGAGGGGDTGSGMTG